MLFSLQLHKKKNSSKNIHPQPTKFFPHLKLFINGVLIDF